MRARKRIPLFRYSRAALPRAALAGGAVAEGRAAAWLDGCLRVVSIYGGCLRRPLGRLCTGLAGLWADGLGQVGLLLVSGLHRRSRFPVARHRHRCAGASGRPQPRGQRRVHVCRHSAAAGDEARQSRGLRTGGDPARGRTAPLCALAEGAARASRLQAVPQLRASRASAPTFSRIIGGAMRPTAAWCCAAIRRTRS